MTTETAIQIQASRHQQTLVDTSRQIVTWTAFAILAIFKFKSRTRSIPCQEKANYFHLVTCVDRPSLNQMDTTNVSLQPLDKKQQLEVNQA